MNIEFKPHPESASYYQRREKAKKETCHLLALFGALVLGSIALRMLAQVIEHLGG